LVGRKGLGEEGRAGESGEVAGWIAAHADDGGGHAVDAKAFDELGAGAAGQHDVDEREIELRCGERDRECIVGVEGGEDAIILAFKHGSAQAKNNGVILHD